VVGSCECGNEPSDSIKCNEILDWLRTGQLLKRAVLYGVSWLANYLVFNDLNYL
jgi:hypothetical protein